MTREEKMFEVRRLHAGGLTAPQIAERLGMSESTVRNWWRDTNCADCGRPIDGSGRGAVRCSTCAEAIARAEKYWTAERIIDAIQRFAREHGRPPSATDWIRTDPENGYPATSCCFQHSGCRNAPFRYWADAIEAAGFPRPVVGGYERSPETLERLSEAMKASYSRRREVPMRRARRPRRTLQTNKEKASST